MKYSISLQRIKSRNFLFVFLIFAIFSYKLLLSSKYGKLSVEATYDDVSYFAEGIRLYTSLRNDHNQFINNFFMQPPGSPGLAVLSLINRIIFQSNVMAYYCTLGAIIAYLFFLICKTIFQNTRISLTITSLFLISPISTFYIFNYRPDPIFSLYFALIALMIYKINQNNIWKIAYSFWLLFLIKPHFAVFIFFLISYFFFSIAKKKLRIEQIRMFQFLTISIILLAIFRNVFKDSFIYILSNTYGNQKHWWDNGESILHELKIHMFQLIENIGGITFSSVLLLLLLLLLVTLPNWQTNKKYIQSHFPLIYLTIISFFIAAFGGIPTPFFYMPFLALLITFCLILISRVKVNNTPQIFMLSIIIGLNVIRGVFPVAEWGVEGMKELGTTNTQLSRIVDNISDKKVLVTFIGPVNSDALNVYSTESLIEGHLSKYHFQFLFDGSDLAISQFIKTTNEYEIVIFLTKPLSSTNMTVPNNFYQDLLEAEFVKQRSKYVLTKVTFKDFLIYKLSQ